MGRYAKKRKMNIALVRFTHDSRAEETVRVVRHLVQCLSAAYALWEHAALEGRHQSHPMHGGRQRSNDDESQREASTLEFGMH